MSSLEAVRGALKASHARHAEAGNGPSPYHKAPQQTPPVSFGSHRIQPDLSEQSTLSAAEIREMEDHFFSYDCKGG